MEASSPGSVCPAGASSGAGGRQSQVDGLPHCGRRGWAVDALSSLRCHRAEGGLGALSPLRPGRLVQPRPSAAPGAAPSRRGRER